MLGTPCTVRLASATNYMESRDWRASGDTSYAVPTMPLSSFYMPSPMEVGVLGFPHFRRDRYFLQHGKYALCLGKRSNHRFPP